MTYATLKDLWGEEFYNSIWNEAIHWSFGNIPSVDLLLSVAVLRIVKRVS